MPNRDGTGPTGQGPTGGLRGNCKPTPLTPGKGRGRGRGRGHCWGLGLGRGLGRKINAIEELFKRKND